MATDPYKEALKKVQTGITAPATAGQGPTVSNVPAAGISKPATATNTGAAPAWLGYSQSGTQQATSAPAAQQAAQTQQPVSRTNQTLNSISQLVNQQPYQFKGVESFAYDQYSDPAYQAALETARRNITQQQADTNAQLRAGGQGRSSYSEQVANQIGADQMSRVSSEVLPQLISQAYQRYSDQANRDMQLQQLNYGAQQGQIGQLAQLYGLQNQQDFSNPLAEAQSTGQYLSGEARQYIDAINALKQQAETAGITREARNQLSAQADQYRAALQGLGVDPSLFGADVNRATAVQNANRAGIQTLAGRGQAAAEQQQAFNQQLATQQQQLNNTQVMAALTGVLPDGTPTTAEQQRQLSNLWTAADALGTLPDQLADMYGLPRGTQTQAAKQFAASQALGWYNAEQGNQLDWARFGLQDQANQRDWLSLDYQMAQGAQGQAPQYRGMSANQVLTQLRSMYETPVYSELPNPLMPEGPNNQRKQTGASLPTDQNTRLQMLRTAAAYGLPYSDLKQVLLSLGFSQKEIDENIRYTGNTGGDSSTGK